MNKWKQAITAIFASLGFTEKVKENTMTNEDWAAFDAKMKEEHKISALDALKKAQEEPVQPISQFSDEDKQALAGLLGETPAAPENSDENVQANENSPKDSEKKDSDLVKGLVAKFNQMQEQINALGEKPEEKTPEKTGKIVDMKKLAIHGPGTNKTHLYGIADSMFALDNRWNIAAAKRQVTGFDYTKDEKEALMKSFDAYGQEVGKRFETLQQNGQLSAMVRGELDYTDLETELGAYYRVRRQDAIISYIITLPSIASVLPIRYNVQDEEVLTNHFVGASFSQAFQAGHVFAGSHEFQAGKAKVKDVMFKYKFTDLKKLEKEFIGYLNREGSDPMKWNFIEWLMVRTATVLQNEKEVRRVKGVRVEPTSEKASFFNYASDGILTTLDALAYAEKPSVYAIDSYKAYTRTTMVDYVWEFVRAIYRMRGTLNGMVLCMNDLDVYDYLEGTRTKYGKDSDFAGEKLEIKNFIYNSIVRIPNMGMTRKDVWMMPADALEIQENRAGEAFAFYFQRDLEQLIVASWFKEGTFAFAGKKFDTKAAMIASKGMQTQIFKNHPVTELAADATTADGSVNELFQTTANSGATALTDITNAVQGVAYRIFCGSVTHATTVAKAAKFDGITAAYTPTAVGDYLRVIYNPTTSKFIELERKVGGTITVNAAAKAPEYVAS